ncbi:transposase [Nostoc sp.]|uniref:RNA-guided endonuclease InsQ/TnpB family protein n=1 Tax=Nostoc sp. TaxID=1180 RepID=UPI002FF0C2D7
MNALKSAPQEAFRSLRTAWDRWFKKTSGVPNFKKKGLRVGVARRRHRFTLEGAIKVIGSNKIQVPKIGILKTYENLPQLNPKSVSISRQADRWFISFRFEVEQKQSSSTSIVGVDLGVKALATLSSGEVILGSKSYRRFEAKLSRLQWLHRHQVKGSANWKKRRYRLLDYTRK